MAPAAYGPGGRVPLKPFTGTIGVAPGEAGDAQHRSAAPGRRQYGRARRVRRHRTLPARWKWPARCFPSATPTPPRATARSAARPSKAPCRLPSIRSDQGRRLNFPRFTTAGPVSRHFDEKGYEVTTGIGPDLMPGSGGGLRHDRSADGQHGMSPVEAYMLCSVCADLRISEIVDQPNWVVSFYFPRIVLE